MAAAVQLKPRRGPAVSLPAEAEAGVLLVETDTGRFWLGAGAGQALIRVGRYGPDHQHGQTPPAFGAAVSLPDGVIERQVLLSVAVGGGLTAAASVNAEVETAPGSGVYQVVARWRSPISGSTVTVPGSFPVGAGRRYRIVEDETGGSRAIVHCGWRDLS